MRSTELSALLTAHMQSALGAPHLAVAMCHEAARGQMRQGGGGVGCGGVGDAAQHPEGAGETRHILSTPT